MIKLYNGNGGEVEITPEDDSYRLTELMGADEVVLKFALPDYITISAGAYITYKGDRYEVESEDSVRMIHTEMYEYTITLSAPRAHLRRYIVREKGGEGRISFFLTAKPREHLDLIVHNLNEREAGWAVGACLDGSEKTIEYSTTNALDALTKLAEAYGTEWECEGRTLSLRKAEYHKDSPLTVSYGKGKGLLSGLERNPAEEQPVGTLYVTGTDRNIDPAKYKSKTLHLPEGATRAVGGRTYTVTSGGRAITVSGSAPDAVEGAFTDTDIYPSREGAVKTVTIKDKEKAFVDFTDPTIPADLDFEQCLIPGREMKIAFQTGMLAGRTFGAKYVHKDRRFEIVPEEIDGVLMPSAPYLPKEGDRYGVFEIALPESYIRSAEGRLLDSAVQYLEGLETSRYSYRAAVDPLWLKKQWTKVGHKVRIGAYVRLAGDPITDGGATLRITGIKEYLTDPYAPEVTLSDRATGRGGLTSIIRKAVQDDLTSTREASTRTAVEMARRTFHKAEQLTDALEKALGAHFEAMVRPIAVHTMQVLVGDKSLQFAYVENPASTKEVPLPLTFDTATKSLHIDQAYLQHKTLGIEVTTAHTAKDFRTWAIAPIDYTPKGTAPLYLYARVPREGDGGTFVIDTRAHDFKEEAGYYHLWSGMLTPTDDGAKWEYMPMHGFTEITPGMISSPRFTSPDGRLVIDMVKGYFRFKTDKSTFSINADNPNGVYIRGGMISVGGQNLTMEEAFEEQERKIENAKKVRQPIIKNGTWWVWDDTTNQLIDSGKPAQGESGHSLTSSLAFVEGEIRNGVVTKDPVVEYVVYYDGVALDDKLVYDTADIDEGTIKVSFNDDRLLIVGKNRFRLYFDDNNRSKPDGISQTYVITYKGLTTTATATLPNVRDGERGLQGLQGKDGRDGINGKDGTSSYTHIAYATDNKGGNFSQSPEGCDYIGMYVDSNPTDSTNPHDYQWTKFVGKDGRNGSDGTPGKPGKDGRTPFLHIAYANSPDGKQGFSVTDSSGRDYIGQYTDYSQPDSSDPSRYTWSRIKGEKGEQGHSLTSSLKVTSGYIRNGYISAGFKLAPTFLYDGEDVTAEAVKNMSFRWDKGQGQGFVSWIKAGLNDGGYVNYEDIDLSDYYEGEGATFEVKTTYRGLATVASAFVPHIKDGTEGLKATLILTSGNEIRNETGGFSKCKYYVFLNGKKLTKKEVADSTTVTITYTSTHNGEEITSDATSVFKSSATASGSGDHYDLDTDGADDISSGLVILKTKYKGYEVTSSATIYNVSDGEDGHSFTASLRVEGNVEDGHLYVYKLRPSFFYNGREVTGEIGDNFLARYNLNEAPDNLRWDDWEPYTQNGEYDLSDDYSGPGVSFEVKATYKGLTTIASAFVPHSISPEKLKSITDGLQSAITLIKSLQEAQDAIDRKMISEEQLSSMKYLLDAIKYGKFDNLGGLILAQVLALSNRDKKVTSYMSGFDGKGQHMLAAGVTGFGTSNEHADVYLDHDGDFYLSKDDTFLKFDPKGRFALTLFGGKLNIPGVLYAGLYNRTTLRSMYDTIPADYAYGQLKVVADARKAAKQDHCDFYLDPIGAGIENEKDGYTDGYALTHNAGTKNYVPIVIGFDRMKITKVDENHFEFVYHEDRTAFLRSIWVVILGENRADYD